MPKFDRDGYERFELFLPRDLSRALQAATRGGSTTAWVCALIAAELGIKYAAPKRGPKPKPVPASPRRRPRA